MNAPIIIFVVILLLAGIGTGLYFYFKEGSDITGDTSGTGGGTKGRYVKLSQPTANCMNIGDIQVLSAGTNIAKGKLVTQSSRYAEADFPVTNLVDEVFTNFAHTSCKESGWLSIDLGSDVSIDSIKVINRKDCCSGRIIGAKLEVTDSANKVIYTSEAFKGKTGQTAPVEGMDGFAVYTVTLPSTVVTGSDT